MSDTQVRIDRVVDACLMGDTEAPILFRFKTLDEFRAFIGKVLVIGGAKP